VREHEQRANAFLAQKKPNLAIPEFRAVLAADPTNLDALANLGVLLYFQQDFQGAVPLLRQAVAQKADLTKIHALLGLAEMNVGQMKEARGDLEVTVPLLSEPALQVQAGLALIGIDAASQDVDKAAAVVAVLRQAAPTDPRVLFAAYDIASQQAGEAMLLLSLVAPDSAQMHEAMALELGRARDTSGAIINLRKAAQIDPALPGIHYELAEALRDANDESLRAEAESQFKIAVALNPRDARSTAALGDLAKRRSDIAAATAYYKRAFAIDPKLPDSAIALADLDINDGNLSAAAGKLEIVLEADPSDMLAHYKLAGVYRKLGRRDDAARELEAFQHYKNLKKTMQAIYQQMRQHPPGGEEPAMSK
jgi:Tfp pilus assembly protein PilF